MEVCFSVLRSFFHVFFVHSTHCNVMFVSDLESPVKVVSLFNTIAVAL